MKRTYRLLLMLAALFVIAHGSLLTSQAQGIVQISSGSTVPTNCTPKANNVLFYKNSGANIGLYECTAANTWIFRGALNFGGALTPTALSGNVNDYNPTGLSASFAVRIDGGASDRNITGLATGVDGRLVLITNIGSTNNLTLVNQSSSSTAANRFLLGADLTLGINQAVMLRYDGTSSRWRPVGQVLAASGATAGSYGPATITIGVDGRITAASNSTATAIEASMFCSDAGSTDTYACSLSPAIASYVTGTHYRFKANTANTGAATINLNALGAKTIVKVAGGITTTLADNDIRAGQWVDVVYDGTNMQMGSVLGNAYAVNNAGTDVVPKSSGAGSDFSASRITDTTGGNLTIDPGASNNVFIGNGATVVQVMPGSNNITLSATTITAMGTHVPFLAGFASMGSNAKPFTSYFVGSAATNNVQLGVETITAARLVKLPDTALTLAEGLLSRTTSVDMNTATATTLYTCPSGKSCVITKVVIRNASTSLTTASYSFGWNSASFNDVIANATHTELTGNTLYTILFSKAGAAVGTTTGTFNVLMNTLQGGAATTTIEVFGFTF